MRWRGVSERTTVWLIPSIYAVTAIAAGLLLPRLESWLWSDLGARISVALNGKTYIDLQDDHIKGAGAVGLWTKADSVTAFDDFSFGSVK